MAVHEVLVLVAARIQGNPHFPGPLLIPLQGAGSAAELEVTSFTSPPVVKRGSDEVSISYVIANNGDIPSGIFRTSIRASTDTLITIDDALVDTVRVANIAIGLDTTINVLTVLPKAAPRGDVYLGVIADDRDEVPEVDEDDKPSPDKDTPDSLSEPEKTDNEPPEDKPQSHEFGAGLF